VEVVVVVGSRSASGRDGQDGRVCGLIRRQRFGSISFDFHLPSSS